MTRLAVGVDRVVALLVGSALVALAVLTVTWQNGTLGAGRPLRVVFLAATNASWWPWASAAAGVLLIAIGLRWLLTHHWAPKARAVALDRNDSALSADAAAAARAAADRLSARPAVLKATGTAAIEAGQPVVSLHVTVPARRGLASVTSDVDDVARTLSSMFGGAVAVRSVVRVKATKRALVR